jgi:hypothetical protein
MFSPRLNGSSTFLLSARAVSLVAAILSIASFALAQNSKSITEPLSPTSLNIFNFDEHSFKVQYPPGSSFPPTDMTVEANPLTQPAFSERVAGTQFSNAVCDVYLGGAAECIDYKVTCSYPLSQQPKPCPAGKTGYITVETSFNSNQSIVNPGFLTTPNGENYWSNILTAFYLMRIDPTSRGHTKGFSEFVSVALGATDQQGLGDFSFDAPLRSQDPRSFPPGVAIPINFSLTSAAHPGQPVTGAIAGLTVLMVTNGLGQRVSDPVFSEEGAFHYVGGGIYNFSLPAQTFPKGTYILTVFGDAFATQATSFTIQ